MIFMSALVLGLLVGFGGGWYCNTRFGAKAAAIVDAVEK